MRWEHLQLQQHWLYQSKGFPKVLLNKVKVNMLQEGVTRNYHVFHPFLWNQTLLCQPHIYLFHHLKSTRSISDNRTVLAELFRVCLVQNTQVWEASVAEEVFNLNSPMIFWRKSFDRTSGQQLWALSSTPWCGFHARSLSHASSLFFTFVRWNDESLHDIMNFKNWIGMFAFKVIHCCYSS